MKNKGFTLIELLAVIVILAIIALIATPIILNIIGSSKKSAVVRSGELYLKAVETAIARENLDNQFNPTTCVIGIDGNLTCDGDKTLIIEISGSKPTSGTINLSKGKIISVENMILDGNELKKEENGKLKLIGQSTNLPEEPENPKVELNPKGTYLMVTPSVNNADTYFLGQEKIKRNQVETITVTYTNKIPSNAIDSWDVSELQDESVMAWYTDIDNNNLYELYIGGEGGVKANPNSSSLFSKFNNVITIDASYLDTNNVTSMAVMFNYCQKLTSIDLSRFDTSKVTNMGLMFENCGKLTSLDLNNFDTSQVTNMNSMFSGCSSLTSLDLNNFDTSKVTNMGYMFTGCSSLTSLDLSSFNTSQITEIFWMFYDCRGLTTLDMRNATFTAVINFADMFKYCNRLTTITVKDVNAKTFIDARLADASKTGVTVTIA